MPSPIKIQCGPCETLAFIQDPAAPSVVLLHGFGANHLDLLPLAQMIQTPKPFNWFFPNAMRAADLGGGQSFGRAWFGIDMIGLQSAMLHGNWSLLEKIVAPDIQSTAAELDAFMTELPVRGPLIVGGFSQGAMVTCALYHTGKYAISGLLQFSGTFAAHWATMPAPAPVPVFQSHGTHDPILPFELAERLSQHFTTLGCQLTWSPFHGGHEIPNAILQKTRHFLAGY